MTWYTKAFAALQGLSFGKKPICLRTMYVIGNLPYADLSCIVRVAWCTELYEGTHLLVYKNEGWDCFAKPSDPKPDRGGKWGRPAADPANRSAAGKVISNYISRLWPRSMSPDGKMHVLPTPIPGHRGVKGNASWTLRGLEYHGPETYIRNKICHVCLPCSSPN